MAGFSSSFQNQAWLVLVLIGFAVIVTMPAGAWAQEDGPPSHVTIVGNDPQETTDQLVNWLESHNYIIGNRGEGWFTLRTDHSIIVFSIHPTITSLDRLVAVVFLTIRDEYKTEDNLPVVQDIVRQLNEGMNTAQFSLDQDNDLAILSQMTFIDRVDLREFQAFINWFDSWLGGIAQVVPEVTEILR